MSQLPDYYRILHVHRDAPVEVIRASYRTIMQSLKQHPDLGGDHQNATLINEAYAVLTDEKKREAYDQRLADVGGTDETGEQESPATGEAQAAQARAPQGYHLSTVALCAFCKHANSSPRDPSAVCSNCGSPLCAATNAKLEHQGQRAVARIERNHPIVFHREWPGEGSLARTRDISLNGISLVTDTPVEIGTHIKISGDLLGAVARVTHCQRDPGLANNPWIIGAAFVTLKFAQTQGSFVSARI